MGYTPLVPRAAVCGRIVSAVKGQVIQDGVFPASCCRMKYFPGENLVAVVCKGRAAGSEPCSV